MRRTPRIERLIYLGVLLAMLVVLVLMAISPSAFTEVELIYRGF
jgi:hypothetical protein